MNKYYLPLLIHLIISLFSNIHACNCNHTITLQQSYIDGSNLNIQPGDTICIEAGERLSLKLINFHGSPENYIVFKNCGGAVIVQNYVQNYGISINNSSYFRFTGTGNSDIQYGIKILGTKTGASGLGISDLSTNFEIDHIEIANTGFAGIFSKTDPKCDLSRNRGNFTQYQSFYHHNYIHNTAGEGIYIGHSFYSGYTMNCDGIPTVLYPHELKGVRIYNNIVDSVGWDGIQVGCATEDCEIYGNIVTNYGNSGVSAQHTGIQIGGGTTGKCYNNKIINGSGPGIAIYGLGNNDIYNNIIANAGYNYFPNDSTKRIHGIVCDDRETIPNSSFNFYNNTIVNPKTDGIRFMSVDSRNNRFHNNIIVRPGSLLSYNRIPSQSPYINIGVKTGVDVIISHNYFYKDASNVLFADTLTGDYQLTKNSPCVDSGLNLTQFGINYDFDYRPRPIGDGYDIGAYELDPFKVIRILPEQVNVDAASLNILPGDTVYLETGTKNHLRLVNFQGSPSKYIVIKNYGGPVNIQTINMQYGIKIGNSKYFRFTGSGTDSIKYGIRVLETPSGATGLSVDDGSTNFEVDHIEVANTGSVGIISRTNVQCDLSTNRENFTQYQTIFHDNYIHNTALQGMIIGHVNYLGLNQNCDGQTTTLFPSVLKGVRIYNNIIDSAFHEAISVNSATEDCEIYNNNITNYGLTTGVVPKSGIAMGAGTTGNCYNNFIANGAGHGILINGLGNSKIYNNIIANAGYSYFPTDSTKRVHGILCEDKSTVSNESFNFYNNTIVSPKTDGIRFTSTLSQNNEFYNNIIINPGSLLNYIKYFPNQNPYINVGTKTGISSIISNNYFDSNFSNVHFEDSLSNYRLQDISPAIDSGLNLFSKGILFDFDYNSRTMDSIFDIGAFEYQNNSTQMKAAGNRNNQDLETPSDDVIKPIFLTNFTDAANHLSVFPNPNNGSFALMKYGDISNLNIYILDMIGNIVYSQSNVNESFKIINLKRVKGIYHVKIWNDTVNLTTKIIVN